METKVQETLDVILKSLRLAVESNDRTLIEILSQAYQRVKSVNN